MILFNFEKSNRIKNYLVSALGGASLLFFSNQATASSVDISDIVNSWRTNESVISENYDVNNKSNKSKNNTSNYSNNIYNVYNDKDNKNNEESKDNKNENNIRIDKNYPEYSKLAVKGIKKECDVIYNNIKTVKLRISDNENGQGGVDEDPLTEDVDSEQSSEINNESNNGSNKEPNNFYRKNNNADYPSENTNNDLQEIPEEKLEKSNTLENRIENRNNRNSVFKLLDILAGDYNNTQKKRLERIVDDREATIKLTATRASMILTTSEENLDYVLQVAEKEGIPYEAMVGIMTLENGGSVREVSSSGCVGLFQLARRTEKAIKKIINKELGYAKYNANKDDRKNPRISTELAARLLRYNYEKYGRWDFSVQAYHDGEGYLNTRIAQYVSNQFGKKVSREESIASVINKYDIKLVDVIADWNIPFTKESRGYVTGVICMTAKLAERQNQFADNRY